MNRMLNLAVLESNERQLLRDGWAWFVGLGALFTALGVIGLVFVGMTTLLSVIFIGWMFLIAGIVGTIHAVVRKGWSGFWFDLLTGLVTTLAGAFIVGHPLQGASVLTFFVGAVFLVGGVFRLGTGIGARNPYAGWFLLHGLVSAFLGLMILTEWPYTAWWVIGTVVAIDLLIDGLRLISLGFAAKHMPMIGGDEERRPAAVPPA